MLHQIIDKQLQSLIFYCKKLANSQHKYRKHEVNDIIYYAQISHQQVKDEELQHVITNSENTVLKLVKLVIPDVKVLET